MDNDNILYEISENIVEIKTKLENVIENTDLKMKLLEEKLNESNKRGQNLENAMSWLWKTSLGGIIGALISIYFEFK